MTVDWTLIGNWILQGAILAGFGIAGVWAGLRLFGRQQIAPPLEGYPPPERDHLSQPSVAAPRPATGPAVPAVGTAPKTGNGSRWSSQKNAGHSEARHAFEFGDDGRLTVILEMPGEMLEDDEKLVTTWVDTVGWARMEQSAHESGRPAARRQPVNVSPGVNVGESGELQEQLNTVLQRLHLSAERRRHLRSLLEANFPAAEEEA